MAHVTESDASAAADSTAFGVRGSAFGSRIAGTAEPAGWAVHSFSPVAPAFASGDGTSLPAAFGAVPAR